MIATMRNKVKSLGIPPVFYLYALVAVAALFIFWKVYNMIFGTKMVADKNLDSAEKDTLAGINESYVSNTDLTINDSQAEIITNKVFKELSAASIVAIMYSEANINEALKGLGLADKVLIVKKFGLKPLSVNTVFGLFGDAKNLTMNQYAKEVLTANDYNHFSGYFTNVSNFV